ncbi:REPLICATION FACTOR C / DNA polymerase III GAMMA-TAU SUBUNIT [Salix viminalis]|uniref:REPLICATION FACTOR C / DNA polymerase III GAMMA-TAU SUBUNIT n=1 Tax=Salix viminalis TaxID=40686 RepID=A0A9Q0SD00_SALVM|nr:REPLICATION FACTOR C / DNA polymerase III GAMMA-TAU SUBUNIT [Salix viminalis]
MADGRRHSVDLPITRTLIALRRVRSLRDPSTNSMSKFPALLENATWETNSTNEISIQFAKVSKEGRLNHNGLSGWKNLCLDEHSEDQVDKFDSQYDMGKAREQSVGFGMHHTVEQSTGGTGIQLMDPSQDLHWEKVLTNLFQDKNLDPKIKSSHTVGWVTFRVVQVAHAYLPVMPCLAIARHCLLMKRLNSWFRMTVGMWLGKRSWKHITNETPRSLSQKFRPKSFDELVGQNVVVRSLLGAISKGRITSLYLFHGPRGTGKTSASRIFAAALNCLSREYKPCGVCRECAAFFSGRSRDVKEVDSMRINRAKRIGSLIKNASMPPFSSRFKVFIVDECHLLNEETWGTVLNSLENLSQNVVFVMVTPELDMLPRSAVTRCQKYHFTKIKDADIAGRLRNICVEEDLDVDQVALDFIAAKSSGSLRDAEIMLDQLSLLGRRITLSLAHELIGVVSDDELFDLLDLALSSDTSSTVIRARELMGSRIDPMRLVSQLANLIMDVLAGKCQDNSSEVRRKFSRKHASEGDLSSLEASPMDVNDSKSSMRNGHDRDGDFSSTPSTGESLKHLALRSCEDSKLERLQVQGDCKVTLDSIWKRASELCNSNSLRSFLRKQGKLSSLHFNKGLAVAELEFHHPNYASKAEKSWKFIASSLQTVLGCNVEIRINLVLCAPVSKCGKLRRLSFNLFGCSRRTHYKSHPPVEGGSDSDYSDHISEKPMIREKAISACPSDCGSQAPHNCYHRVEVGRALRNSEGNVLSIGPTSSHRSLPDDASKTPGHGFPSSKAGESNRQDTIFSSQEAEDQPNCFPKRLRLPKKSRSSDATKVVRIDNHQENKLALSIPGKESIENMHHCQ